MAKGGEHEKPMTNENFHKVVEAYQGLVFTICLNSYRASGTGGYDGYVGCPIVREIGTEMSDLLLDYFKRYGGELPLARGEFRVF